MAKHERVLHVQVLWLWSWSWSWSWSWLYLRRWLRAELLRLNWRAGKLVEKIKGGVVIVWCCCSTRVVERVHEQLARAPQWVLRRTVVLNGFNAEQCMGLAQLVQWQAGQHDLLA